MFSGYQAFKKPAAYPLKTKKMGPNSVRLTGGKIMYFDFESSKMSEDKLDPVLFGEYSTVMSRGCC